jgi:glutathione-regulated potassium-efflux system ancillary protein KefC
MLNTVIILLAAAVVLVPIAKRLGLGAIVGYLLAGVIVGPGELGVIQDVDGMAHVSELGVAMMLFVIGLELEPRRLWSLRRDVFGAGLAQMLVCGAVLFCIALATGMAWRSSLLVGLALALSSTAIAVQLMTDRNILATPTGGTAFGILLFQDLAAIPLIALVALLSASEADAGVRPLWQSLAVFAAAIVVGRLVLGQIFRRIAAFGMREIFTAAALLLVLGMSSLMAWAGFSMALGAFLAGVLLADSEYRKALETDIEPFKGLLLGLFFLTVGASLDLKVLRAEWVAVIAVAAVLFAAKLGSLWLLARPLGVPVTMRLPFAALLAQGGEFALVVFSVALASGLLGATEANVLNSAVAASMALTPIAVTLADRWACRGQGRPEARAEDIHPDHAPVLIAGFGRVGQIAGRLLFAHGVRANVLDRDPDQIDTLKRFGFKVFYGDATRLDLLRAAGAGEAKILINAIDDVDANLEVADLARENFPHLRVISRARNVQHYYELKRRGVQVIERETFESALRLGRDALEALGASPYEARLAADKFRRHNTASVEAMFAHYGDQERMQSAARAAREEFEQSFQRDRELAAALDRDGWQGPAS